jgi:hypothetical protein
MKSLTGIITACVLSGAMALGCSTKSGQVPDYWDPDTDTGSETDTCSDDTDTQVPDAGDTDTQDTDTYQPDASVPDAGDTDTESDTITTFLGHCTPNSISEMTDYNCMTSGVKRIVVGDVGEDYMSIINTLAVGFSYCGKEVEIILASEAGSIQDLLAAGDVILTGNYATNPLLAEVYEGETFYSEGHVDSDGHVTEQWSCVGYEDSKLSVVTGDAMSQAVENAGEFTQMLQDYAGAKK